MSFDLVELSSVAATFNGKTPSRAQQRDSGFPVLKIKDVSEERRFRGKFQSFVDNDVADKSKEKLLKYHDTLILNAAHNADYVGSKQYRAEKEVVGSLPTGEWLLVRSFDDKKLHPMYLNFYLRSNFARHQIKALVKGIHLYPKDVARLKIPLPPLPIQKQIAAVLEKADTLRSQCQQMEQELNSLAQSLFLDMFGDPVTNPKEWPQKPSKELCKLITVGIVIKPSSYYVDAGIPALRSLNVRENYISNENFVYFDEKVHEQQLKKTHVYEGDVVIVRSGQPGRSAVIPKEFDGANAIDILITRPNSDLLNSFYFSFFLNSEGGRQLVLSNEKGQVQKHLNVGELSRALIPVPPIALQNEFEYSLNKLAVQMRLNKDLLTNCDQNFNSLMQRAFKGELNLKDVA